MKPDGTLVPWDPILAEAQNYDPLTEAVLPGAAAIAGVAAAPTILGYAAGEIAWPFLARAGSTVASWFCLNDGDCTNEAGSAINTVQRSLRFWNRVTNFRGNKVYQRNDLIEPMRVDAQGVTNLERMLQGKAPIGPDGWQIQLHHMLQTQEGPIAEVTRTFHQMYTRIIHIDPPTVASRIDRATFRIWREAYWTQRARDFIP